MKVYNLVLVTSLFCVLSIKKALLEVCRDRIEYCSIYMPLCKSSALNPFLSSECRKTCEYCDVNNTSDQEQGAVWGRWKDVTSCSKSCGGGNKKQKRKCKNGNACTGRKKKKVSCNTQQCREGTWTTWETSRCSVSCGSGIKERTRTCPAGKTCTGTSKITLVCSFEDCISNVFSYGTWSQCSRTCDWGTRSRQNCSYCSVEYEDCRVSACAQESCLSPFYSRYKVRTYDCCNGSSTLATSCGISSITNGRIVSGNATTRGVWPWMVQIELSSGSMCGGSLFSNNFVFTAAHCFRNKFYGSVVLRFGALYFRDDDPHVQVRVVTSAQVSIHAGQHLEDDIAIIKLGEPVIIGGDYVRPICLPQGEAASDDIHCVAAGWGSTHPSASFRLPSDILYDVVLRILPFDICQKSYPSDVTSTNKMICAGRISGGTDTCRGDSGGPLMCQRCSSCAWFLAGITSFGSRTCGLPGYPGVYSKVSGYEDWINSVLGYDATTGSYSSCP